VGYFAFRRTRQSHLCRTFFPHDKAKKKRPEDVNQLAASVVADVMKLSVREPLFVFDANRSVGSIRKILSTPKQGSDSLRGCSQLFHGKVFAMLALYADESGTHDPSGQIQGSQFPVVGGLVAPVEIWAQFSGRWQEELNRHGAPFFHFSEWVSASGVAAGKSAPSSYSKSPYNGWGADRLDALLFGLAGIIRDSEVVPIFGGGINAAGFHSEINSGRTKGGMDPRIVMVRQFFRCVLKQVSDLRPEWAGQQVAFYFDQSSKDWQSAIAWQHAEVRDGLPGLGELSFADKKRAPHLPLQAADLVAYRFRQMTDNFWRVRDSTTELDKIIFDKVFAHFDRILGL